MANQENQIIAQRLKEAIKKSGLKQVQIVEKTGINKGSLSSYLKGTYKPKQKNLYLLARLLDVSETWLMGLDVPMNKKSFDLSRNPEVVNTWCKSVSDEYKIPISKVLEYYTKSYLALGFPTTYNGFVDLILSFKNEEELHEDPYLTQAYVEDYILPYYENEKEKTNKDKLLLKIMAIIDVYFTDEETERLYKLIELSFPDKISKYEESVITIDDTNEVE